MQFPQIDHEQDEMDKMPLNRESKIRALSPGLRVSRTFAAFHTSSRRIFGLVDFPCPEANIGLANGHHRNTAHTDRWKNANKL
jgi:hypothetical protein